MDGTSMVIEVLGRIIVEKDAEIENHKQTIEHLNKKISLFGRCQINTFYVGYGSGGDVKPPYQISILEGLINCKANLNNDLIEKYLSWTKNNIPDELGSALFGTNITDLSSNIEIGSNISQSTASAIERTIAPSVIMVFGLILMILLFIVIHIIIKKLIV